MEIFTVIPQISVISIFPGARGENLAVASEVLQTVFLGCV